MSDVKIGDAIIAGIADGDTVLEKMSEIINHLRLAGFEIVPVGGRHAQRALLPTIEAASNSLIAAMIGSCTCLTKTPETEYHSADCRYRKIASALDDLDTIRTAVTSSNAPAAQCAPDATHYLNAIRVRLETLYAAAADNPRLREQLSDEVDWIDAQLSAAAAQGAPERWIFEHQDGQRFFADKDIQHGKMAANAHWGENKWTCKPLFAGPAITSTSGQTIEKTRDGA